MTTYTIVEVPLFINSEYVGTYKEYLNDRGKYIDHEIDIEEESLPLEQSVLEQHYCKFIDDHYAKYSDPPEAININISETSVEVLECYHDGTAITEQDS